MMAWKFIRPFHQGGYAAIVIAETREQAATRLRAYTEMHELGDTAWIDDADVTSFPVDRAGVLMWVAS